MCSTISEIIMSFNDSMNINPVFKLMLYLPSMTPMLVISMLGARGISHNAIPVPHKYSIFVSVGIHVFKYTFTKINIVYG